jgi:hypothetical protein
MIAINHRRCAVIPMISNETGQVDFEILVYGRFAHELMTVPNDVIAEIVAKHPEHTSSPFLIYDLGR